MLTQRQVTDEWEFLPAHLESLWLLWVPVGVLASWVGVRMHRPPRDAHEAAPAAQVFHFLGSIKYFVLFVATENGVIFLISFLSVHYWYTERLATFQCSFCVPQVKSLISYESSAEASRVSSSYYHVFSK